MFTQNKVKMAPELRLAIGAKQNRKSCYRHVKSKGSLKDDKMAYVCEVEHSRADVIRLRVSITHKSDSGQRVETETVIKETLVAEIPTKRDTSKLGCRQLL